ncbi:uncharacterized protein LOC135156900 [Lytechinus pictus]|uniref:uncharacterized protein LOC135156900 n=1 Tax=Lytechinus pictus TaxID=7653 RepID=UPI0030BA12EA
MSYYYYCQYVENQDALSEQRYGSNHVIRTNHVIRPYARAYVLVTKFILPVRLQRKNRSSYFISRKSLVRERSSFKMATQHRYTYTGENKISMKGPGFHLELDSSSTTKISFSVHKNEVEIVLKMKEEKEVLTVGVQPEDERNIGVGLDTAPETSGTETSDEEMSEIGPLRSEEGRQVYLGLPEE